MNRAFIRILTAALSLLLMLSPMINATAAGNLTFNRELKQGDEGEDVRALQERLKALGYYAGTADGLFGPDTGEALAVSAGGAEPERQRGLSLAGIALNDGDFAKRDIRIPEPFNLLLVHLAHADDLNDFFPQAVNRLTKKLSILDFSTTL